MVALDESGGRPNRGRSELAGRLASDSPACWQVFGVVLFGWGDRVIPIRSPGIPVWDDIGFQPCRQRHCLLEVDVKWPGTAPGRKAVVIFWVGLAAGQIDARYRGAKEAAQMLIKELAAVVGKGRSRQFAAAGNGLYLMSLVLISFIQSIAFVYRYLRCRPGGWPPQTKLGVSRRVVLNVKLCYT